MNDANGPPSAAAPARSIASVVAATPAATLQGRTSELAVLRAALDILAAGRPAVALVEGEAGIGKSRLLNEALADARSRGFSIAKGQGDELERTRPFGAIAEALDCRATSADPRRRAIAALLATGGPRGLEGSGPVTVTSDAGLQFRVVDAIVDLVETLALHSPLVIALDDLQWVDPSSLITVAAIDRRFSFLPVAVIGCYRSAPRLSQLRHVVDALIRSGATHVGVGRLDESAVEALVAELVAGHPGPTLLREVAGAGGNPLFITELLAAIESDGILEQTADGVDLTRLTLPPSLRLTILRRLSYLPDEVMDVLRTGAILGARFSIYDLAVSTAVPAGRLAPTVTEAIAARVLEEDGDRLRFCHDLIREALYDDIPRSLRLALHRETGQRLAAAGAPTRLVAEQMARGATAGDLEAVTWLTTAAREAAPRSPEIAVDLFDRAVDLMDSRHQDRDSVLAERASALMSAGRVGEAESAWRSLLRPGHDPAVQALAHTGLGLVLLTSGRPSDGLTELQLGTDGLAEDDPGRASGLGWACICRMWLGDLDGALALTADARAAASISGNHTTAAIATAMVAVVTMLRGDLDAASETIDAGLDAAERSPGRSGLRYPIYAPRAFILLEQDRLDQARSALEAGTRRSDEMGIRWHEPSYQMVRAVERFVAGEWDEAVDEVTAGVELAGESGESYSLIVSRGVHSLICLHRNQIAPAAELASTAIQQLIATEGRYRSQWAVLARALVLEAEGDAEVAYATLAEAWDRCSQLGLALEYRVLAPDLVRLALATGHRQRAADATHHITALAAANSVPSLTGAALRCRGMLEDELEPLHLAVEAYADGPRVVELARAREELGVAFLRRGDTAHGRPQLDEALETYERLGAQRDIARVDAALRTAGIRRGSRRARCRPELGWGSLTPAEETVARLAAEGLTNPQIGERLYVSRRTVQTHIAHVFVKLGISSRTLLGAEVARQDAAVLLTASPQDREARDSEAPPPVPGI